VRHTTFRYRLDPTVEQLASLWRHAGASRFAYNQCPQMVNSAIGAGRANDRKTHVPWSGFDLINAFNAWKTSDDAGRVFAVDSIGQVVIQTTGLAWRGEVCQQVFEEAAVDCGRALTAWSDSRSGKRRGKRSGFPRFKSKGHTVPSFRMRNRHSTTGKPLIRVGERHPRAVTLPRIGVIRVHDDTRPLRRLLGRGTAKILYATVNYRAGQWWLALNVAAPALHPALRHPARDAGDKEGWVGVDLGLTSFLVAATADGSEVARVDCAPKPLASRMRRQRTLARSVSRKKPGSNRRKAAVAKLARHHHRVRNIRRHFLHQVSNELVKTHDRLVFEDLNVVGMRSNRSLARAIADAGWADFLSLVRYKQGWREGLVISAERWFPSTKLCSVCGAINREMTLGDRLFSCPNGHQLDRDRNAAANLANWGRAHFTSSPIPDRQAAGRVNNAR
jgi:putative transposase